MKKLFSPLAWLFMAVVMFASCLGDSEDESVYYKDTAISSFVLGTMNRYLHTTSSIGTDSVYKQTYAGSAYKFYIDHVNRTVYNTDSLPYGTDAKHVVCIITSKNLGSIGIKSLISDSIFAYRSSDSIDFSSPRIVRILSNDMSSIRDYTVKVNVHQERADEFKWQQMTTPEWMASMQKVRALSCGDRMFVFGSTDGTSGVIYSSPIADGNSWTAVTTDISTPLTADIVENVAVKDDMLYMKVGDALMRSANGENWETVSDPFGSGLKSFYGTSSNLFFAAGTDGALYASDNGSSWWVEPLDDQTTKLPTTDINIVSSPLVTDETAERIVILGNRDITAYPDDDCAVAWAKVCLLPEVEEPGNMDIKSSWMLLDTSVKSYALPRMNHLVAIPYADGLLALGAEGLGACNLAAFSRFYLSLDGGINWVKDSRFSLPKTFASGSAFAMTVDSNHFIWLFCSESGQVWRGRLNESGWQKEGKAVTE